MRLTLDQYRALQSNVTRGGKKKPLKRLAEPTEAQLQAVCVQWFRTMPRFKHWIILHIPNQGTDRAFAGRVARLIAMGMIVGVHDLLVIQPDARVCFIEMKRPGEQLGDRQEAFHLLCVERGIPSFRCESFAEFQAIALGLEKNLAERLTPVRRQA